jgi:hypothetical protein
MIRILRASAFVYGMARGQTRPCIIRATKDGAGEEEEVVVKWRAGFRDRRVGPCNELLAALLAKELGLLVPEPVLVVVDPGFDVTLPSAEVDRRRLVRESIGLNLGSAYLGRDWKTWPQYQRPRPSQRQSALEILAFDALIQNGNRSSDNPNLLFNGEKIAVYDHESTFSHLQSLPKTGLPWTALSLFPLSTHVFYSGLKGRRPDLHRFEASLDRLQASFFSQLTQLIPSDWKSAGDFDRILQYLTRIRTHRLAFIQALQHLLA